MYLREIRLNWQALIAGAFGIALGTALGHYTLSLFGPAMLKELGWSKSQFALIGSLPLVTVALIPVAGRLTDRFGTRVVAIVGFTTVPLGFLMMSAMSGSLAEFFAIYLAQHVLGIFTSSLVFCRVIVERFDAARGIALSLMMSAPPLAGAIVAPFLGEVIADHGWRAGYLTMAAITAGGGTVSILLMGRNQRRTAPRESIVTLSRSEFLALVRHPTLLLIVGGMLLVNSPQPFAASQLKLIALGKGVADGPATAMVSLYALGVIVGRLLTGMALDAKIKPHKVSVVALGLPAIGYLMFASGITAAGLLMVGVLLIGLAQGAESDVGAYLISHKFGMENFSLLLSFVTMSIVIGSALGSTVLSFTLHDSDSYVPFLTISVVGTLIGAVAFGLTGMRSAQLERGAAKHMRVEQVVREEIG